MELSELNEMLSSQKDYTLKNITFKAIESDTPRSITLLTKDSFNIAETTDRKISIYYERIGRRKNRKVISLIYF